MMDLLELARLAVMSRSYAANEKDCIIILTCAG